MFFFYFRWGGMGNIGINGVFGMCFLGFEVYEYYSLSFFRRSFKAEFCGWRWFRVLVG